MIATKQERDQCCNGRWTRFNVIDSVILKTECDYQLQESLSIKGEFHLIELSGFIKIYEDKYSIVFGM